MDSLLEFPVVDKPMDIAGEALGDRSSMELPGVFAQVREDVI